MLAKLNLGLGATCPPQATTDYQLPVGGGAPIPVNSVTLATMADVTELEKELNPFYPGLSPVVQEYIDPAFPYQYVDGTGRKAYTISYGGVTYNVGQQLNSKCNYPNGLWAVVNGRPMWVQSQDVADSLNRAGITKINNVTNPIYTPLPSGGKVVTAVTPSPQTGATGNNSVVNAGSTPNMTSNDGTQSSVSTNVPIGGTGGISPWLLVGGALVVGFFMFKGGR